MSISKGGQSVKPYVGGKEVKEAYVGSQKVYSAAPPVYYGFLGAENDYMKADWCQLTRSTAIAKDVGIYRMVMKQSVEDFSGIITIREIHGSVLKFMGKTYQNITTAILIEWVVNGQAKNTNITSYFNKTNYSLYTFSVPAGTTKITIYAGSRYADSIAFYVDNLRFENE